jgi:hypothetical protein
MYNMLVELHEEGSKPNHFTVSLEARPSKVKAVPSGDELYLNWNATVDDSGRIRTCILCGHDLYKERSFPQVTGIVVVLAFAGGIAGLTGFLTTWAMLGAMLVVLFFDFAILILDKTRLVCYGCNAKYKKTPIAPQFSKWDKQRAEQIARIRD